MDMKDRNHGLGVLYVTKGPTKQHQVMKNVPHVDQTKILIAVEVLMCHSVVSKEHVKQYCISLNNVKR